MKTRQDLIAATLKLLNAIAAGQNPEAEDVTEIDQIIDGKILELNRRQIIFFTDTQQFSDEFIDPLAVILANQASPAFGQARDPQREAVAIATLYDMMPSNHVEGSVQQTEYF